MSTVAIRNTMAMNNTEKKVSLVERFKKYLLDNAEYFAEAFRLSLEDPDGLEQTAPHIAAYVKRVQNSLKN